MIENPSAHKVPHPFLPKTAAPRQASPWRLARFTLVAAALLTLLLLALPTGAPLGPVPLHAADWSSVTAYNLLQTATNGPYIGTQPQVEVTVANPGANPPGPNLTSYDRNDYRLTCVEDPSFSTAASGVQLGVGDSTFTFYIPDDFPAGTYRFECLEFPGDTFSTVTLQHVADAMRVDNITFTKLNPNNPADTQFTATTTITNTGAYNFPNSTAGINACPLLDMGGMHTEINLGPWPDLAAGAQATYSQTVDLSTAVHGGDAGVRREGTLSIERKQCGNQTAAQALLLPMADAEGYLPPNNPFYPQISAQLTAFNNYPTLPIAWPVANTSQLSSGLHLSDVDISADPTPLDILAYFPSLIGLELFNLGLQNSHLPALAGLHNLQRLTLMGNNITTLHSLPPCCPFTTFP